MAFRITVTTSAGTRTYVAIGNRDALMDSEYDRGALGVTVVRAA